MAITRIYVKPCARGGCTGIVEEIGRPKRFERRIYCSGRCAAIERHRTGRNRPPSKAAQRKGGRIGGRRSGDIRMKQAVLKRAARVDRLIPQYLREDLTPRHLAAIRAIAARSFREGYRTGYECARFRKSRVQGGRIKELAA